MEHVTDIHMFFFTYSFNVFWPVRSLIVEQQRTKEKYTALYWDMKGHTLGVVENIRHKIVRAPTGKFLHSAMKSYRARSEMRQD